MGPFELAVATALAVGPAVDLSAHAGPSDWPTLHVVVDSALGVALGAVLVALYLVVLRRLDGGGSESDTRAEPSSGRRGGDS